MVDARDITYGTTNVGTALDELRIKTGLMPAPVPVPVPVPAPTPTPTPGTGKLITPAFFGMHTINGPWSSVYKIGALAKPANCKWAAIETSAGVYNWSQYLDKAVDSAQAHGVDMIYNALSSAHSFPLFYRDGTNAWPTDFGKLTNFLKAVAARYAARNPTVTIYYEVHNEAYFAIPLASVSKLVATANAVLAAVPANRVIGPDLVGHGSWPAYFDAYFAAGGPKNVRAITVHGYSAFAYAAGANVPEAMEHDFPLKGQGILAGLMPVLTKHGLLNTPLWDTEGSWGPNHTHIGKLNNQDIEAAYTARWLLGHMQKYERTYWYGHSAEGERWGTLQARKGETAFKAVQDWTLGARLISDTKTGSVRKMTFDKGLAVWDVGTDGYNGSSSFPVPAGMTKRRDLDGTLTTVGATTTIGMKPIFLST